jgi:ABC-type transport system involved in cytochrome c biogenesis permease component
MIRMGLHLFGYDLRAFVRNRQSQFFTLALPVLFLLIFASVFGGSGNTTQVAGGQISTSVYYVPGIIALGVIAACFGNLAASVTAQRERGVLKRRRATPVPAAAVIAARVLTAVAVTVLPPWLADAGEIFPVRHLANALLVAYNPHTTGLGFAGLDLLIVAAWGVAGLLIALRKFSWLPLGR